MTEGRPAPDVTGMRRSYDLGRLMESDLAPTWLEQLKGWIADAVAAEVPEPNAMTLATATPDGVPGARTVLLRGLDERGLAFYTNLASRKGRELAANPRAALVFAWIGLQRQVIADGAVTPVEAGEADAYFASRPIKSRLAAVASPQSQVIPSRESLERLHAELIESLPPGAEPQRPDGWGGLRVAPERVEFWQGRRDRLHDRLCYRRVEPGGRWVVERLAP